jgi:alkanesulfonate monooxygenase SsuD/methylene tetrahydromethanopterin reductase-like flavin-dependent oxidoreductase (luciferase family)
VWTQERPAFAGSFASFGGIQARPQPHRRPHPPVIIGGHSPQAFRRAVQHGNGWYGFALDADAAAACIEGLRRAESKHGRRSELGPLEISVTPRGKLDPEGVKRFADLGVQRLIVYRPRPSGEEILRDVRQTGETLIAAA